MSATTSNSNTASATELGRYNGDTRISGVHPDIIQTHILTRLDGPTLVAAGCATSDLHLLSNEEKLWRDICNSTWPSTVDPRVRDSISAFPAGHRSFFSDAFPAPQRPLQMAKNRRSLTPATTELISAIDIHYQGKPVFSKVRVMETENGWFQNSPFRVDLLDPKESVPTPVKFETDEELSRTLLHQNMTVSWVIIDSTRNRAVNISSPRPVWVRQHWLTGDLQVKYATILTGARSSELAQCEVVVTCGGKEGGEMHVKEVTMQVEDMDGKIVNGKGSLVILQEAMEGGRRRKGMGGEEEREMYKKYVEMTIQRRESKERRERSMDMVCVITGVTIFLAFWALILFR